MRLPIVSLLVLLGLISGCAVRPCKSHTVMLSLSFDDAATLGCDKVDVAVTVDGKTSLGTVDHVPGRAKGSVQIDFPNGYPAKKDLTVTLTARTTGRAVGGAEKAGKLEASCSEWHLSLSADGGDHDAGDQDAGPTDADTSDLGDGATVADSSLDDASAIDASGLVLTVSAAPASPLTVEFGTPTTVKFSALQSGTPVTATWAVDDADVATIGTDGTLTPTGTGSGKIRVTATVGADSAYLDYEISVLLIETVDSVGPLAPGIGGDGAGTAVSSGQQGFLSGVATTDTQVKMLYPYDGTVWPKQIPAPLLQWNPGPYPFDAVYVHVKEQYFEYRGYLGKNKSPFQNVPFPQTAWTLLTKQNRGESVDVTLTFLNGTNAIGPLHTTWKIASAPLPGCLYFTAYNTALVKNAGEMDKTGHPFGAAIVTVQGSSTTPTLVAGSNSSDYTGCRSCHSVAAGGSALIAQHGDVYANSSLYTLSTGVQTVLTNSTSLAVSGLTFDGKRAFASTAVANDAPANDLFTLVPFAKITTTGLQTSVKGGMPAISNDSMHVAVADHATRALGIYDFDGATTFANYRVLYTPSDSAMAVTWPAFVPTSDAIVFEQQVVSNGMFGETRGTARGELWLTGTIAGAMAVRLDRANGSGYTPTSASHPDDSRLNYQPSVSTAAAGGYLWVAFTSRRLYGNVATTDPSNSDPRNLDLATVVSPKKIWIAAVDPNALPGADPSYPAFYLPNQELRASNGRPQWGATP